MKFGICLTKEIEAAHALHFYQGKPEPIHGHTWKIEIFIEGPLNEEGYVADFVELEKLFTSINSEFDHNSFNNHPYFKKISPTTEHIAKYYFDRFKKELVDYSHVKLKKVHVWEGRQNFAYVCE